MEKITDWIRESGTGEQAQESALADNLNKVRDILKNSISDYSTSAIESGEIKDFLSEAKEFLEKLDNLVKKFNQAKKDIEEKYSKDF